MPHEPCTALPALLPSSQRRLLTSAGGGQRREQSGQTKLPERRRWMVSAQLQHSEWPHTWLG